MRGFKPVGLGEDGFVPYFLWDETTTLGELRRILSEGPEEKRTYYIAKIMREACYRHVWSLVTLSDVLSRWPDLLPRLGRSRPLWEFLIDEWSRQGLIASPARTGPS